MIFIARKGVETTSGNVDAIEIPSELGFSAGAGEKSPIISRALLRFPPSSYKIHISIISDNTELIERNYLIVKTKSNEVELQVAQ